MTDMRRFMSALQKVYYSSRYIHTYTKEELLEELHDEELHDEEPYESDAEGIEEVIDTLTECLAALPQNDIDAYLESFESDNDESCSSDLNDVDYFGSEEEDEVGAIVDDASHLVKKGHRN
jgi:hypothetical protein